MNKSLEGDPENLTSLFLSKNRERTPYPLQQFFDYLERRSSLPVAQQRASDLHELEMEVKQHPERPRSLYLLAEALLKAGREKGAMQVLQRLEEVSGGDRTELGIGILLGRFRSYPAAIQYLQAVLKTDPASDDARYNLGKVYFQSGNYQAAVSQLRGISSPAHRDGSYLALLGDVYAHLGRSEEAEETLKEAVRNSPDNDQCYVSLVFEELHTAGSYLSSSDKRLHFGLGTDTKAQKVEIHWASGIVQVLKDIPGGQTGRVDEPVGTAQPTSK